MEIFYIALPFLVFFLFFSSIATDYHLHANALGSMSSAAAGYGGNGPCLCDLHSSAIEAASRTVDCYGSDGASVYGAPLRLPISGLTAGDGFICGLTKSTNLPYCWGNNIYVQQGIPSSKGNNITYTQISAGDNHLCALRRRRSNANELAQGKLQGKYEDGKDASLRSFANVDCWGYNMTGSFLQGDSSSLFSLTSGALFSCGLFVSTGKPICWGDDTGSGVLSKAPKNTSFRSISAGGYHVCGILEQGGDTLCWGRALEGVPLSRSGEKFSSLIGGKFHACGLLESNRTPLCWGLIDLPNGTLAPTGVSFDGLVAGDYYTCGFRTDISPTTDLPICWGSQFPDLPMTPASMTTNTGSPPANTCLGCANPPTRNTSIQAPVIVAELSIAVVVVVCVLASAIFFVKYKLSNRSSSVDPSPRLDHTMEATTKKLKKTHHHHHHHKKGRGSSFSSSFRKEKVQPEFDYPKMARAETFTFDELEQATDGFSKENEVGKGSFSCVYRGVLGDGRVVAVKRAVSLPDQQRKNSNEFRNELDLLSKLNHAHLLTLLGFCDDPEERLLVYEFMANGTLHEQIHGKNRCALGWVRRITIAVQAGRGLEYLHSYACPPVIHRDIKSSNILLDDDWNARVSDFGLSLLGPLDGDSPLSEVPAGTLGYLDPEYYRLHYLTTKSDVYSFGVLLLEILSGRKAIDMEYEEGNIVEWAVPRIRDGQVLSILDPILEPPHQRNLEAILKIAQVAVKCVKMRGKDRPSMDKVTTSLERALATMIGTYSNAQPFLPTEVVLGSNRLHRKSSQKSSCRSGFGVDSSDTCTTEEHQRDHRNPSSITVPSIDSYSMRRRSVSDNEVVSAGGDVLVPIHDVSIHRKQPPVSQLEIYPSSPQESLYLNSNF